MKKFKSKILVLLVVAAAVLPSPFPAQARRVKGGGNYSVEEIANIIVLTLHFIH